MICPRCAQGALERSDTEEGYEIDFCSGCGLIWFAHGELTEELFAVVDLPHPEDHLDQASSTSLICPKCPESNLVEFPFHPPEDTSGEPLLIDYCHSCQGISLDRKELALARLLAKHHGLRNLEFAIERLIHHGHALI